MVQKTTTQSVVLNASSSNDVFINVPSEAREIVSVYIEGAVDASVNFQIDNDIVYRDHYLAGGNQFHIPNSLYFPIHWKVSSASEYVFSYQNFDTNNRTVLVTVVYRMVQTKLKNRRILGVRIPVFNGNQSQRVRFSRPVERLIGIYGQTIQCRLSLIVNNDTIIQAIDGDRLLNGGNGLLYLDKPFSSSDNVFVEQSGNQINEAGKIFFYYE
jgi:hypothetical protein